MEDFLEKLKLVRELISYVEDNGSIRPELAKDLISHFPDYTFKGTGYRAISGKWQEGFSNISWSTDISGAKYAAEFTCKRGSAIRMYAANIFGFDVRSFLDEVCSDKNFACSHYDDDNEVLVTDFFDVEEMEEELFKAA